MGSKAHDQLLTEFMQEMDGLSSAEINKDKRIVVIGATNRPFDLDDAVLRRLPRRLLVDLPGPEDRKCGWHLPFAIPLTAAILTILLKGEKLGGDVDLERLVKDTDGFSGSDLKRESGIMSLTRPDPRLVRLGCTCRGQGFCTSSVESARQYRCAGRSQDCRARTHAIVRTQHQFDHRRSRHRQARIGDSAIGIP